MQRFEDCIGERFSQNLSISCAFHIRENVRTKYGATATKFVIAIAKEFSTREEESLLEAVSLASPTDYRYLRRIPRDTWKRSCLEDMDSYF